jgi:hypothetical protein
MSAYRKRWIEVLKEQGIAGWQIDEHGRAVVIKVPDENLEAAEKHMPTIIDRLIPSIGLPAEWIKFIFYNGKIRTQYILNPELVENKD